jgi:hypothetical protein
VTRAEGTAGSPPALDPGLARERTFLAWNRSGLAAVVCIAVLLRRIWPIHGAAQYLALGLVAAAAMLWATALVILARSSSDRNENLILGPRVFGLLTTGTLLLAFIGLVLAFVPPSSG